MESKKEYKKKYYLANRERLIKQAMEWALKNPEKTKETGKRWRSNNKDKEIIRASRYRKQNIEKYLYRLARYRAKRKGMEFDILIGDLKIPMLCPLLRIPLGVDFGTWNVPTIDRLNNNKGYVKGNVVIISKKANVLKNDSNGEELIFLGLNLAMLEEVSL